MGTPGASIPARLIEKNIVNGGENTTAEGIVQEPNYSKAIQSPAIASPNNHRFGNPDVKASYSTHKSILAIIFKASNYYGTMTEECKLTLVGKLIRTRPQIEKIRSKFAEKITVTGSRPRGSSPRCSRLQVL